MIAALTQSLTSQKLPINWFDATIVIVLGFGLFRGRRNGMTKEIVPTVQWLVVIIAAGLTYGLVATFYNNTCGFNKLWAGITGYLSVALIVFTIFSAIKKAIMPRLTGSNVFGGAEYYAGMPSGMIRYGCMLFFALAFLNARSYTSGELLQQKIYNERWYGGGIYSGDYIPSLNNVQDTVFRQSFTGPYIKNYLGMLLIQTGPDTGGSGGSGPPKPQPIIHIGS